MVIIFLLLCGVCFGSATEKWVDVSIGSDAYDGNSDTDEGGGVGPYATISKATDLAGVEIVNVAAGTYSEAANNNKLDFTATHDGRTIEIIGAAVATTILDCSFSAPVHIYSTGLTLAIRNMTLRGSDTTSYTVKLDAPGAAHVALDLTLNNCVVGTGSSATNIQAIQGVAKTGTPLRNVTLTDCELSGKGTKGAVNIPDIADFTMTGTTVLSPSTTAAQHAIILTLDILETHIRDSFIGTSSSRTGLSGIDMNALDSCNVVEIYNTEFWNSKRCFVIQEFADTVVMNNNSFDMIEVADEHCVDFGVDDFSGTAITNVIFQGNTIEVAGTDDGIHGLFFGRGIQNYSVTKNIIDSPGFTLVLKSTGGTFTHNTIIQKATVNSPVVNFKGAIGNTFTHNTLVGNTDAAALTLQTGDIPTPDVDSEYNIITDNIVFSTGTVWDFSILDPTVDVTKLVTNTIDRNCLFGATHNYSLDTANKTIAQAVTFWTANAVGLPELNDRNTISVNPGFKDPANGDYTPTNPELKLDDNTWIGGVQPVAADGSSGVFYNGFFE